MKKIALLSALVAAFLAASALAHPFDDINYECKQLDPARDGIKCLVRYDGSQPTLYIRHLYTAKASRQKRERMRYVVSTTQRNFVAMGGVFISRRFVLDGVEGQVNCSSLHRRPVRCWDPVRVSDLENPLPWPF